MYLVAHEGENPSNEEGFSLMEAAFESSRLLAVHKYAPTPIPVGPCLLITVVAYVIPIKQPKQPAKLNIMSTEIA
jgi:hypothetical protein